MFAARYLGAEGFGILSLAISFTGVFGILADLGLSYLMTREVARDHSQVYRYLGNILTAKIFLSLITFGLIVFTINLLNYPENIRLIIVLIGISVIIGTFSISLYSLFQAYEKMGYQALSQVLSSLLMLIGALIVIGCDYGIMGFAFIYLASNSLILLFNIGLYLQSNRWVKPKLDLDFLKKNMSEALPFGLNAVSFQLYLWIDTIILSFLQGNDAVGLYNAAYRLIIILFFLTAAINTAIFPLMSKLHVSSKKNLIRVVNKFIKLMIFTAIPLAVVIMLYSEEIILLIYGENYISSAIALQILAWSALFIFIRSPLERLHESINRQSRITYIYAAGIIVNILLNLALIPRYSFIGSSVAILITDCLVFLILTLSIMDLKYNVFRQIITATFKVSLASIITAISIVITKDLNLFLSLIVAPLLFFTIIYLLRVLDEEDLQLLKSLR